MLVGVAFFPPSFPPFGTYGFYIIKRQNCVKICNRMYNPVLNTDPNLDQNFQEVFLHEIGMLLQKTSP